MIPSTMNQQSTQIPLTGGQVIEVREWNFNPPPADYRDVPVQLLTIGGVSVSGIWQGYIGEFYSGWSPIKRGN
jgi:hypothetical protein